MPVFRIKQDFLYNNTSISWPVIFSNLVPLVCIVWMWCDMASSHSNRFTAPSHETKPNTSTPSSTKKTGQENVWRQAHYFYQKKASHSCSMVLYLTKYCLTSIQRFYLLFNYKSKMLFKYFTTFRSIINPGKHKMQLSTERFEIIGRLKYWMHIKPKIQGVH